MASKEVTFCASCLVDFVLKSSAVKSLTEFKITKVLLTFFNWKTGFSKEVTVRNSLNSSKSNEYNAFLVETKT